MENEKKSRKQGVRFTAVILITIIFTGALLSFSMYDMIQKSFFQSSLTHEMELMRIMERLGAQVMDFRLKTLKEEVESIAVQFGEELMSGAKEEEELLSMIEPKQDVLGCYYQTRESLYTDNRYDGDYLAGLDLSKAWAGEILLISPDFDEADRYLLTVAAPVWTDSQKSEVAGVLVELLDGYCISNWIGELFLSLDLGTSYIIDGEGRNIATAREENFDWITTRYNAQELAKESDDKVTQSVARLEKKALDGETGIDTYLWGDGTSYVAYGPLTEADWGFCVGFYGNEFEKYTQDITNISIRIAGLMLTGFALFMGVILVVLIRNLNKERRYSRILRQQKSEIEDQALQMAASEERFRIAMQRSRDVILEYQLESGEITCFYGSREVKSGCVGEKELRKRLIEDCSMDEDSYERFEEVMRAIKKGLTSAECFLSGISDHGRKWYKMSFTVIPNGSNPSTRAVGILQDVTSEHEAELDSLTRLLNKSAMTENVRDMMQRNRSETTSAFAMLDIDYFKSINDTHGHPVGDKVLSAIAQILKDIFPEPYLTGRFGGDEFSIYCPSCTDVQELKKRLMQLTQRVKEIAIKDCANLKVTLSIGAVLFSGRAEFEDIYKRADEMLYEVKEAGRDGYRVFERG